MSWSGGTYTKGNAATGGWAGDASLGIGIEAGRHDTQDNDFATGINQCLNKDGSNAATGNLNFGGFLPTNIGAGTAAAVAIAAGNDVNTGIFAPAADNWAVATNGAERVRVDSSGRVGIGITNPSTRLDLGTNANGSAFFTTTNGTDANLQLSFATQLAIITNGGGSGSLAFQTGGNFERMRITSGGLVGINTSGGGGQLHVNSNSASFTTLALNTGAAGDAGNTCIECVKTDNNTTSGQNFIEFYINSNTGSGKIAANGASAAAFATFSDERLKENIEDLPSQLDNILALRPVEFDYKNGSGHQIGFIAQEVEQVYPDLIGEDGDYLVLADLNKNDARLIKAFQELAAKVEALEAKVQALEAVTEV